jgi:hypothetical protein
MPHRFGRMPHPCRAPFRTICRNAASGPLEILQDFRCRIPRNVHVSDERGNQDQRDDPAPETAVRVGRTGRAIGPRGRELARRSAAGPCEARGAKRGRRRSGGRPERVPCRPVAARPAAAGGRVPADGPGDPPQVAPAARSSAARRMRVFVSGVMMDPPRERGGREDQGRSSSAKERDEGATTHVMYVCIFSSVGERKVRFRGFARQFHRRLERFPTGRGRRRISSSPSPPFARQIRAGDRLFRVTRIADAPVRATVCDRADPRAPPTDPGRPLHLGRGRATAVGPVDVNAGISNLFTNFPIRVPPSGGPDE